jgi:hypothetical protein
LQLKVGQFSKIRFSRELRLVDLVASGGLTRMGAEGSLANGLDIETLKRGQRR